MPSEPRVAGVAGFASPAPGVMVPRDVGTALEDAGFSPLSVGTTEYLPGVPSDKNPLLPPDIWTPP